MSESGGSAVAQAEPFGYVVVDPGTPEETTRPLFDRLFVGRECAGVDEAHRIVLGNDLTVSRNHLEIRVDPETSQAVVVDTSSNGVRVNGIRIERAVGVPLNGGDKIQVGDHVLIFRSERVTTLNPERVERTISSARTMTMAMVVGDLIHFSTVSEQADPDVLSRDVHVLYQGLRQLLTQHKGTLVDYVGDAFFASWELEADPAAVSNALHFALDASALVVETTSGLELRYDDGSPLRMGWAATMGSVIMRLMPGSVVMVLGDAVNVGFRISSIAGRDGRPAVLATQDVRDAAESSFAYGQPETVPVKGRVGTVTIYGVAPR
jgi:adenylate cyclase